LNDFGGGLIVIHLWTWTVQAGELCWLPYSAL